MTENENNKRKKLNQKLILFIPLAVVIMIVFAYMQWMAPSVIQDESGRPAPNFRLPDLEGRYVSLDDYRGKVVLLNIWATWCPACVAEKPSLQKLHGLFKDDDFKILSVSIDEMGERAVGPFMRKHDLNFPVLVDPHGSIMALYGTRAVPESFIIRRDGTVDGKVTGAIDWAGKNVVDHIRKLIND